MKRYLLALTAALLIPLLPAAAGTVQIPDADDAVASITFPDDWNVEEVDGGWGADSPDEHVYLSAVAVKDKTDMDASLDEVFEMLKEHNVEFDLASKTEEKFKINDLEAHELNYKGKDKDGPTSVSIVFVPLAKDMLILTYWVTTAHEAKYQETVGKIVRSLKPAA